MSVRYELRHPVPSDAMLRNLVLDGTSSNEWTPRFSSRVYDYNVAVPHSTERTSVQPTPVNPSAIGSVSFQVVATDITWWASNGLCPHRPRTVPPDPVPAGRMPTQRQDGIQPVLR